jgi:5-methylcytosine-specific restriction endonuclease McrA
LLDAETEEALPKNGRYVLATWSHSKEMRFDKIAALLELLEVSEDEALKAIIAAVAPLHPGVVRQNWSRLSTFGNSAPATSDIWQKLVDADFRCSECRSQLRVTLDHIDGDSKNHSANNLRVLCFVCNRKRAKKGIKQPDVTLRVTLAVLDHWRKHKVFPSNQELMQVTGLNTLPTYLLRYLRKDCLSEAAISFFLNDYKDLQDSPSDLLDVLPSALYGGNILMLRREQSARAESGKSASGTCALWQAVGFAFAKGYQGRVPSTRLENKPNLHDRWLN